MLIKNLSFGNFPLVKLSDTVYQALQMIYQYHIHELCVVDEDVFIGIIKEETLLSADDDLPIQDVQQYLSKLSINENDYFLKALALAVNAGLSILPVTDSENKVKGILETSHLLQDVAGFLQVNEPGAIIVLEVDTLHYSFAEICRLVESNDTQITQLNTSKDTETGKMLITLKINKLEISDIVSTFQRYEYNIKYYFGEEFYTNELKSNYENLMSYLNV